MEFPNSFGHSYVLRRHFPFLNPAILSSVETRVSCAQISDRPTNLCNSAVSRGGRVVYSSAQFRFGLSPVSTIGCRLPGYFYRRTFAKLVQRVLKNPVAGGCFPRIAVLQGAMAVRDALKPARQWDADAPLDGAVCWCMSHNGKAEVLLTQRYA